MRTSSSGASLITLLDAVIPSGGTVSNEVFLGSATLSGMITPSALTTDTKVFFQEQVNGIWYTIKEPNDNTDPFYVMIMSGQSAMNLLVPSMFIGIDSLRVCTETNQASDREFILKVRPFR